MRRYRFPPRFVIHWIAAFLRGWPRSLEADAAWCLRAVAADIRVEGAEHVPPQGAFALVANHYQREGLWVGWSVSCATHAVARLRPDLHRALHWVMTAEWPLTVAGRSFPNPLLRFIFTRLAEMYDLVALPALQGQVQGRAGALRTAAAAVTRRGPHHALGFFPEGETAVGLQEAQPGSGDFLLLLARAGVPIVPCGLFERGDAFVVRFGPPVALRRDRTRERTARDAEARSAVMVAIGRLLPPELWGHYAAEIEQSGSAQTLL